MRHSRTQVLRQVLRDGRAAEAYRQSRAGGPLPKAADILLWASVRERSVDTRVPDHVLANIVRSTFPEPCDEVWSVVQIVLRHYSTSFLRLRGRQMFVDFDLFGEWQAELAGLSPLPLIAFTLAEKAPLPQQLNARDAAAFVQLWLGDFAHTVLPVPYCLPVDALMKRIGLTEIHLHLNGTTEIDKVWQDTLANPQTFDRKVMPGLDRESAGVREAVRALCEQISPGLTYPLVAQDLRHARSLRIAMALAVTTDVRATYDMFGCLMAPGTPPTRLDGAYTRRSHPLMEILGATSDAMTPLQAEIVLLAAVFSRLTRQNDPQLAQWLHEYLLILNAVFLPLCVQTEDQRGFDQFQKLTFTQARAPSEQASYTARFHQINRGTPGDLSVTEGRFSPNQDADRLRGMVETIASGYVEANTGTRTRVTYGSFEDDRPKLAGLTLTPHLIKQRDQAQPASCRHASFRAKIAQTWRVLARQRAERAMLGALVRSLDAAANELHTPPEVFAPVFRAARRAGIERVTYHAGEDFEHLLSGIRAVCEALTFLDLHDGDRIGHATAIGIDPQLWLDRTPPVLRLTKGDHLDNLVLARTLIADGILAPVSRRIDEEIHALSRHIYGHPVSRQELWGAWRLRKLDCTLLPFADSARIAIQSDEEAELDLLRCAQAGCPEEWQLFVQYHDPDCIKRAAAYFTVEADILTAQMLRALQDSVTQELIQRGIALETLPSSNVRISVYDDFAEHHISRWVGLDGSALKPAIIVGSDDPGIFSCSLRGEYIHLFRVFMRHDRSERVALARLQTLMETAQDYSFCQTRVAPVVRG